MYGSSPYDFGFFRTAWILRRAAGLHVYRVSRMIETRALIALSVQRSPSECDISHPSHTGPEEAPQLTLIRHIICVSVCLLINQIN